MKLATLKTQHPDGLLIVVSRDLTKATLVTDIASTMAFALQHWHVVEPLLKARYDRLNQGDDETAFAFSSKQMHAPIPRTYQWLDGSAFLSHSDLMQKAYNIAPIDSIKATPLMYQGDGSSFIGGHDSYYIDSEDYGIDFEGELGIIVDDVPMNCSPEQASQHIKLIVQLNDFSFRSFAVTEMKTGFGFVHTKPSTSFAPVAITPDELNDYWENNRVNLPLEVHWNEQWFGSPNGKDMYFGFNELVAHAATTRSLPAGTVIGSGTVSNQDRSVGSACISERRAIEMIQNQSAPETEFMKFGDRIQMEMTLPDKQPLFGSIDQHILKNTRKERTQ